jgi:hypothetical protein
MPHLGIGEALVAKLSDRFAAYMSKTGHCTLMLGEQLAGGAGACDRICDSRDLVDVVYSVLSVSSRRF